MRNEGPSKGLEWTNLLLGIGLACAGFVLAELPAAAWNAGIVGTLIGCCSAAALYRYGDWAEWSNLILGCWAVIAPFLLGFGSVQTPMWTHVLIGLCIVTIATMQLLASHRMQVPSSTKSAASR
ncbi:SPW repeat protein [Microvirga sp. VF16]|uniref:SPW repeat protein n=1 Tax=Microvirga sp. VF16 TaxID=2807101 RepID=UPI00193E4B07|nr:SPW repeat protein [Microvirga sp. VF16]QRM27711.1 SPW repeat protein [Microvirga sp. VF16]